MNTWPFQDARARFDELFDICHSNGQQMVTRCGVEVAVLVPIGAWRQKQRTAGPSLKELLLSDYARFESSLHTERNVVSEVIAK